MPGRDLVVIGGSAGSLAPLIMVVRTLPPSFRACVLVVLHSSPDPPGNLRRILERVSYLPVVDAKDEQEIERGIFLARADQHLIVTPGRIRLTSGPKENGFRPAIDPLFRTAAKACGSRVIGVILSGALDDGVYGLREIKARDGLTIVQDPVEADIPTMPLAALAHVDVDYVLPAAAIAPLLLRETVPRQGEPTMGEGTENDPQLPGNKVDIARMNAELGPPSGLTCPDCGGALWQTQEGKLVRFQCHVGHHYSPESLATHQHEKVEQALWSAVRALEERAELRRRMASQTEAVGLAAVANSFATQAREAEEQADQIRSVLENSGGRASVPEPEAAELPTRRKRSRQR
jgi:two-component system, chemotaxis family, protein-glutamate methylesterase/glutaminase